MIILESRSVSDTKRIGRKIGRFLREKDVVAIRGELGAGKTTLVKGIAVGLGVKDENKVASPTFVMVHEYKGRLKIFHLDWYRLDVVAGVDALIAEECFQVPAVTLVEWAERGRDVLPEQYLEVQMGHKGPSLRSIKIRTHGRRYQAILHESFKL